jgi:hypothetical protein
VCGARANGLASAKIFVFPLSTIGFWPFDGASYGAIVTELQKSGCGVERSDASRVNIDVS